MNGWKAQRSGVRTLASWAGQATLRIEARPRHRPKEEYPQTGMRYSWLAGPAHEDRVGVGGEPEEISANSPRHA
jgi:hypothetical protein